MVCGWMAWSGLLVLVVQYVGKYSLPESGLIILFLFYSTILFSYFVFVFCFCFCFCLFRISLFQCISVADVCMLCLSYPVLGHDIALSNALRCIISVS